MFHFLQISHILHVFFHEHNGNIESDKWNFTAQSELYQELVTVSTRPLGAYGIRIRPD